MLGKVGEAKMLSIVKTEVEGRLQDRKGWKKAVLLIRL